MSDRFEENKGSTVATLRELGLPQVEPGRVLLYGPSKEERRAVADADRDVVLLLGDSLPDFHDDFDGATAEEQEELVARHAAHFGRDWIMSQWPRAIQASRSPRSAPIEVSSPWPVWTTVSGGRPSSFSRIESMIIGKPLNDDRWHPGRRRRACRR